MTMTTIDDDDNGEVKEKNERKQTKRTKRRLGMRASHGGPRRFYLLL
jgi:hypothetical protein